MLRGPLVGLTSSPCWLLQACLRCRLRVRHDDSARSCRLELGSPEHILLYASLCESPDRMMTSFENLVVFSPSEVDPPAFASIDPFSVGSWFSSRLVLLPVGWLALSASPSEAPGCPSGKGYKNSRRHGWAGNCSLSELCCPWRLLLIISRVLRDAYFFLHQVACSSQSENAMQPQTDAGKWPGFLPPQERVGQEKPRRGAAT